VKHLLIILISILLLSTPVNGDNHKGETLYGWGKYPEIVWKGFGDKETHPKYTGEVENGEPKGKGIETFPNGEKYVGEFKDGKEHGQGTETSPDGNSYEGEWKDGKQNGQGKWTLPNGSQYVGEWKDGIEWRVTIYDKDGNIDGMVWIGVRQF
jgi:hypothetical protein